MPALLILNYDETDPDALEEYRHEAGPLLVGPGSGRLLAATPDTIDLGEGPAAGERTVVIEYPDVATAEEVYRSSAYAPLLARRVAASAPKLSIIVEVAE